MGKEGIVNGKDGMAMEKKWPIMVVIVVKKESLGVRKKSNNVREEQKMKVNVKRKREE